MKSTYRSRPDPLAVAGSVVVVLAIGNILTNRLWPDWAYVPFNLAVAAVVVALAGTVASPAAMGFADWRRGARVGGALLVATFVVFAGARLLPATAELFDDERVDGRAWHMVYEVLARIPLGTVVLEEAAFRGALPALLARRWGLLRGYVVASALFGLWHVLPAWNLREVNPVAGRLFGDGGVGQASSIALAVVGTFVAGLWLCVVRHHARSLLAPALAHVATNSVGYAIAWSTTR